MKWFLDTNICIDFLRGRFSSLVETLRGINPVDVYIPAVVEAELLLGVKKSAHPAENLIQVQKFLSHFETVPFDQASAATYAEIRYELEKLGTPIGPNDCLIAATVLAQNGTLVTGNLREFARVKGLKLENWTETSLL
jgi:tRNA(fMet)-specific endonuclease VapC